MAFTAGAAARPGKVVGSVLRYNNCGAAAAAGEAIEQRRMVRNSAIPAQFAVSASSYPKRHPSYKSDKEEVGVVEGPKALQLKPEQYIPRKVAAAQVGSGSQWYWYSDPYHLYLPPQKSLQSPNDRSL